MVRALLALLGGVLVRVSAPPSDPPKLAQFSGDVRAATLRGDELSGVRPYTVQLDGGGTEYVYVLALEGAGFTKARTRWGFQRDHNPPHFASEQAS
jgi:hypothetical protein